MILGIVLVGSDLFGFPRECTLDIIKVGSQKLANSRFIGYGSLGAESKINWEILNFISLSSDKTNKTKQNPKRNKQNHMKVL